MAGKSKNSKKVGSSEDETLIEAASTESSEPQEEEQLLEEEPQGEKQPPPEEEPQGEEQPPPEQWEKIKVIDQAKEPCVCRDCNKPAVSVWQSTNDPQGEDVWPLCEPCDKNYFDNEEESSGGAAASGLVDPETQPTEAESSSTLASDVTMTEAADEEMDAWELKKIIPKQEIIDFPIQCDEEGCKLFAAVLWVNTSNPGEKWRGCLDCQEKYFGGWPDEPEEMPLQQMTQEHKDFLLNKCSRYHKNTMPNFSETSPAKGTNAAADNDHSNTLITPPPNGVLAKPQKKGGKAGGDGKLSKITPGPTTQKKGAAGKPSKQTQALHAKWQAEAVEIAGPGARIIVDPGVAKEMIFKFLYDAFRPMSITQIYHGLKVIPSAILKVCLQDMSNNDSTDQFLDSDEEDDDAPKKKKAAKKKESEPYQNSITMKSGKSANSALYYVNYNIAKNGNGLDRDEKEKLVTEVAAVKMELEALQQKVKSMQAETAQLLSEPTNEVANATLEQEEAALKQLTEDLVEARKLKVNENHKQQLKRRIDSMATTWRKRKRLCMDFLIAMEENTDGACNMRKILAGDGQIDIESDEAAVKGATAYAKAKKQRVGPGRKNLVKAKPSQSQGVPPDEAFVAVKLDAKGCVQRVYLDEEK